MSDAGDDIPVENVEVEVTAEAPKGKLSVEDALQVRVLSNLIYHNTLISPQQVLKNALVHGRSRPWSP